MQAGVGAVIASVSIQMGFDIVKANRISSIIMATVFVLSLYFKINIIYIILLCIFIGVIKTLVQAGKKAV